MKKVLALMLALVLVLSLVACGEDGKKIEYYDSSEIPTFTSVTGIELSDKHYDSNYNLMMYIYKDCQLEDLEKYVNYLKDKNFQEAVLDSGDGIILSDDSDNKVVVFPNYKNFSDGDVCIVPR